MEINNEWFKTRDLCIVLGSKLGDKSTENYTIFDEINIIRIDIDDLENQRN